MPHCCRCCCCCCDYWTKYSSHCNRPNCFRSFYCIFDSVESFFFFNSTNSLFSLLIVALFYRPYCRVLFARWMSLVQRSSCVGCSFHWAHIWCAQHNMIIGFIDNFYSGALLWFAYFIPTKNHSNVRQCANARHRRVYENDIHSHEDGHYFWFYLISSFLVSVVCTRSLAATLRCWVRLLVLYIYFYWQCGHLAHSKAHGIESVLVDRVAFSLCPVRSWFLLCSLFFASPIRLAYLQQLLFPVLSTVQHHFSDRWVFVCGALNVRRFDVVAIIVWFPTMGKKRINVNSKLQNKKRIRLRSRTTAGKTKTIPKSFQIQRVDDNNNKYGTNKR